jgi:anti-sigma28 factor (negative regulator of flagellin synthesis)
VETLPDLLSLSDAELSTLLSSVEDAEEAISRRRRVLHGRIDILRAERIERLKAQVADGSFETTPATTHSGLRSARSSTRRTTSRSIGG